MSSGRQDPAEALLSGIERDIERGGRSRGDGLHSRDREHERWHDRQRQRRHDDDAAAADDGDRSSRRRHNDYAGDERGGGGGGGGGYSSRSRDHDYPDRRGVSRRYDDYNGSREREGGFRRRDVDRYGGGRHDPRGGYRDDPYDDYYRQYGGSHRRRDEPRERERSWRDGGAREASPSVRRSPTPPDTRPLSERVRKNSKWGIPPPGFESMTPTQAKGTGMFGTPGQSRTLGVAGPGITRDADGNPVANNLPPIHMGDAVAGVGATQSNRQARRLYVGNIGPGATEGNVTVFFNDQMKQMNFTNEDGDPVLSTQVNNEKGYAFVEFRSVPEATNAMSFDGIIFQGQSIKVRRPKDYVGPDLHPPPKIHVPGVISTNVPDGPNKIYIGGLPTYLNEDQIIELLKSFGELRAFNLVRESGSQGASKGFAFCEYVDANLTELAIQGLNDMELGDKRLLVQRASTGSQRQAGMGGMRGPMPPPLTGANAAPTPGDGGPGEPTKAMMLLNCVTAEELVDDQEYQEIVEDMRDECAKYGAVVDMRIPRPQTASKGAAAQTWRQTKDGVPIEQEGAEPEPKEREGVGRVYVLFDDTEACKSALQAIAGRQFAGRTVIAAFVAEQAFPADEDGGRDAQETTKQAVGPAAET